MSPASSTITGWSSFQRVPFVPSSSWIAAVAEDVGEFSFQLVLVVPARSLINHSPLLFLSPAFSRIAGWSSFRRVPFGPSSFWIAPVAAGRVSAQGLADHMT